MIDVTWTVVDHASTYSIYQSTSSASGPYGLAASGVTGTAWNSGGIPAGNYWFEVVAVVATNWAGPDSSPTGETTISVHPSACAQP
jgi:hypothetical protein